MTGKMTNKQKRFCNEYLVDLNATQAAVRAGYSKRSATQIGQANLNKPHIRVYLDFRLAEMEEKLVAKGDEVLQYLTAVMRGDEKAIKVAVVGDSLETETYVEQKNQIKAAELLAKCHGLMVQRVEVGDMQVTIVDDLAPDDG